MKILIIGIITLTLFSCKQKDKGEMEKTSSNKTQIDSINHSESTEKNENRKTKEIIVPNDLSKFFVELDKDSLKIEVEDYTYEKSFDPSDCIPMTYLPLFDGHFSATESESTGAKAIGKLVLSEKKEFLIIVQQDDYGPIYYGLLFNKTENRIEKSEKIAWTWGDAGDSQTARSELTNDNGKLQIKKLIETCHAELEERDNEMIATDSKCEDSTVTITLN